jgi:hypothetical protein
MITDGTLIKKVDTAANTIIDHCHDKLRKHTFTTINEFREAYKIDAAITVIPDPIPTTTAAAAAAASTGGNSTTMSPHFGGTVKQAPQEPTQPA